MFSSVLGCGNIGNQFFPKYAAKHRGSGCKSPSAVGLTLIASHLCSRPAWMTLLMLFLAPATSVGGALRPGGRVVVVALGVENKKHDKIYLVHAAVR